MKKVIFLIIFSQVIFAFSIQAPNFAPKVNKKFVYNLCGGQNISPKIIVKDIPKEAKSLAVTIFDPDAPRIGGWWHWAAFNLPAGNEIKEGIKADEFLQLKNDYGTFGYGGPCPPPGKPHRYIITVYALKDKVSFSKTIPIKKALELIKPLIIKKAQIVGKYGRN